MGLCARATRRPNRSDAPIESAVNNPNNNPNAHPLRSRQRTAPDSVDSVSAESIRVVSWNIELGMNIERAVEEFQRLPALAAPDVVLLQEMDPTGTEAVANALGLNHRYTAPADHCETGRPFGNAILSPWPLGPATMIPLPGVAKHNGQPRAGTHATVEIDGLVIDAYSIHLETVLLDLRARCRQLRQLAWFLSTNKNRHLIVGGDFNSASARSVRAFDNELTGVGLERATSARAATFHRFGRPFALDHIFCRDFDAISTGAVSAATASDHQPVWVELTPQG